MSSWQQKKSYQLSTGSPALGCAENICVDDNSIFEGFCQDFTENKEIEKKFIPKKRMSIWLAESYVRLGKNDKAEKVDECGTFVEFAHAIDANGVIAEKGKLRKANFCRDRLCPMCAWRRSYKIFAQVSQIMEQIRDKYEFLFLTLTIPNVPGNELVKAIDDLGVGIQKLMKRKKVKKVVKGYFKALEITRNNARGDYHPHFHIVLAVPKSYFKGSDYIPHPEWLSMWQKCMKDNSITQVDIRKAKPKEGQTEADGLASAVAEIAKYAVKDSEYIFALNQKLTDEVVFTLLGALRNRRLCAFDLNGAFGNARKQLNLDDPEDGDLVHIDQDKIDPCVAQMIVRYGWSAGVYKMIDSFVVDVEKEKK